MKPRHLLVGAAAVALAGCGLLQPKPPLEAVPQPAKTGPASAQSSASQAAPVDPCALVTDNDVSVAVGKPVSKHFPANDGDIVSCEWTLDPAFLVVRVTLAHTTKEAFASAQKLDSSAKPVDGLGDGSYYGGDGDLRVLHGTYLVTVKYSETAHPQIQLAGEKAVAAKVLPKL
ncbi:DUF3558 family protein [Fodinicola acaciae]|uniref:DUF3558 family protein n=1 Tax=Fodinicola acaciae TaxID=2681555 RepID=UPI0013D1DFD4|nr:DUF3558 family protein [Fodinicola acaciae]